MHANQACHVQNIWDIRGFTFGRQLHTKLACCLVKKKRWEKSNHFKTVTVKTLNETLRFQDTVTIRNTTTTKSMVKSIMMTKATEVPSTIKMDTRVASITRRGMATTARNTALMAKETKRYGLIVCMCVCIGVLLRFQRTGYTFFNSQVIAGSTFWGPKPP